MSTGPLRRILPLAGLILTVFAGTARCAIDVTGDWYVSLGGNGGILQLVQSGGTFHAVGSFEVNSGTIDSATGAFTLILFVDPSSCGGQLTGTVSPDSRTFSGTAYLASTPPDCMSFQCLCSTSTPVPLFGSRAPCGDGVVDPGEACDDGHLPPGDCCTLGCTAVPAGEGCADDGNACTDEACDGAGACLHAATTGGPCGDPTCGPGGTCDAGVCESANVASAGTACDRDGNACTLDACDGAGACVAGGTLDCGTCATCDPSAGCEPHVRSCIPAAHARLEVRKGRDAGRDRALVAWRQDLPGDPAFFGDPTLDDGYALCLFAPSVGPEATVASLDVPAGGTCGRAPCWRQIRDGFRRRDRAAWKSGGAPGVTLRAGDAGTSIAVRGAGALLRLPASLDVPSMRAQIVSTQGPCWDASFTPTRRDASRFVGRQ